MAEKIQAHFGAGPIKTGRLPSLDDVFEDMVREDMAKMMAKQLDKEICFPHLTGADIRKCFALNPHFLNNPKRSLGQE
jgi:hypothetical protein